MQMSIIRDYTSLDLETTGLEPKKDRIIEIGAVKVRNGRAAEEFQALVNPGRLLDEKICVLTGISNEMLAEAPEIGEVIGRLLEFIGEDILVGHRILFDYSFVKKAAVNHSLVFEKKGIDTLKLSRKLLPELESRSLESVCRYYGIEHKAHRALGDARASSDLYQRLAGQFYQGNEEEFQPRQLVYQAKREGPISKRQKERLYKLLDKHKLTISYNVDKLTRNEADRLMDQILAEYGR